MGLDETLVQDQFSSTQNSTQRLSIRSFHPGRHEHKLFPALCEVLEFICHSVDFNPAAGGFFSCTYPLVISKTLKGPPPPPRRSPLPSEPVPPFQYLPHNFQPLASLNSNLCPLFSQRSYSVEFLFSALKTGNCPGTASQSNYSSFILFVGNTFQDISVNA